jgi:hypothetical protein
MNLEADPPKSKIKQQIVLSDHCLLAARTLSRMKIKITLLAVSPNLKICDSQVFEKWVGFY